MPLFEFTLVGSGSDEHIDDVANRLYETGCDDAVVSRSRGRLLVDFARNAPTLEAAIGSAIEQANLAGIVTDRIEPDPLVSLGEIAERSGLTRQAVSLFAAGHRGRDFPPPVARVTAESPLYDWAEVASWLHARRTIEADVVERARTLRSVNRTLAEGKFLPA